MGKIRKSKSRKYTEEQDTWLKENFNKYSCVECCNKFNATFGTNVEWKKLVQHSQRFLGLTGYKDHFWTKEHKDFIKKYYENTNVDDLVKTFNKKFDKQITRGTLCVMANKLGLSKGRTYSKEEIEWLKNNYLNDETVNETYEKYKKIFGSKKTACGINSFCKKNGMLKPNHRFVKGHNKRNIHRERRRKFEIENDISLDNQVLTRENIVIPKMVYTRMSWDKQLHLGELTEYFRDLHLLNLKLKAIKQSINENKEVVSNQ